MVKKLKIKTENDLKFEQGFYEFLENFFAKIKEHFSS